MYLLAFSGLAHPERMDARLVHSSSRPSWRADSLAAINPSSIDRTSGAGAGRASQPGPSGIKQMKDKMYVAWWPS